MWNKFKINMAWGLCDNCYGNVSSTRWLYWVQQMQLLHRCSNSIWNGLFLGFKNMEKSPSPILTFALE